MQIYRGMDFLSLSHRISQKRTADDAAIGSYGNTKKVSKSEADHAYQLLYNSLPSYLWAYA